MWVVEGEVDTHVFAYPELRVASYHRARVRFLGELLLLGDCTHRFEDDKWTDGFTKEDSVFVPVGHVDKMTRERRKPRTCS